MIELSFLKTARGWSINTSLWTHRGTDEFPSVVLVSAVLYCKTEMILFQWQLGVNVFHAGFSHIIPSARCVYHCLPSDSGYCTVSLLMMYSVAACYNTKPSQKKQLLLLAVCENILRHKDHPEVYGAKYILRSNKNQRKLHLETQTKQPPAFHMECVCLWDEFEIYRTSEPVCIFGGFVFSKVRSLGDWEWYTGSSDAINTI